MVFLTDVTQQEKKKMRSIDRPQSAMKLRIVIILRRMFCEDTRIARVKPR